MYPFEFFPEPKLRLKLPDGNQLNIDDESDLKDWATSKLYGFVS